MLHLRKEYLQAFGGGFTSVLRFVYYRSKGNVVPAIYEAPLILTTLEVLFNSTA